MGPRAATFVELLQMSVGEVCFVLKVCVGVFIYICIYNSVCIYIYIRLYSLIKFAPAIFCLRGESSARFEVGLRSQCKAVSLVSLVIPL